ncbi:MAG: hypothetical protein IJ389_02115 [Clostridia bacterium]|nr:hypothetical protein [Clostridia bacterium]
MKKKLFSRGLYVEGLRQLRLTGVIFLAALLLFGIAIPVIQYISATAYEYYIDDYSAQVVDYMSMCSFMVAVPIVVAPVFTFVLFGGFNKRSTSDFYHSLPYTRICMFISFIAAIFTWIAALTVIYSIATIVTYLMMPKIFIVSLAGMFDILFTIAAQTAMVVFVLIMAMSITGTPVANITCAGLIMFLPRLMITMISMTLSELAPVLGGNFGVFGHKYNVIWAMIYMFFGGGGYNDLYRDNLDCDIYSTVIAIIYALLAVFLFCRRKSETAGHSAPGKLTQHVIRICVGLVISGVTTCGLLMEFEIGAAIILYPIAIIVYFAYELITQKTFRSIPKTIPGLGVLVGLNVLIVAVCLGGAAYVHSYTPDSDDVKAIYLESDGFDSDYEVSFYKYASEKAAAIRIEDKAAIKIATKALRESVELSERGTYYGRDTYDPETSSYVATYMEVSFVSGLGIKKTRNIQIDFTEYNEIIEIISDNKEYKDKFVELPDPIVRTLNVYTGEYWFSPVLTDEDRKEIYDSVCEEIENVDFNKWIDNLRNDAMDSNGFEISYTMDGTSKRVSFKINYDILPKTSELIMDKINDSAKDEMDVLYELLSDYENTVDKYFDIHVQMGTNEWTINTYELYDLYNIPDELDADFKALAKGMKSTEFDPENCIIVNIEYSIASDKSEYGEEWKNVVVYMPNPDDFEPECDYFHFFSDEQYTEEYYKYEYYID